MTRRCSACSGTGHNRRNCASLTAAAWDIEDAITALKSEREDDGKTGRDWRIEFLERALRRVKGKRNRIGEMRQLKTGRSDWYGQGWNAAIDHAMKHLGVDP